MANQHRLPTPGGDDGTWGDILNDFLAQSHDVNGSLSANTVGSNQIKSSSVADTHISSSAAISKTKLAPGVQTSLTSADSAYQKPGTGMPKTDFATSVQTSLAAADAALAKPGASLDGKLVKWNNTSGQLEDASSLVSSTPQQVQLPHIAVTGVVASLRRGVRSTCMQIIGDSTGTDPDEWWGIMARQVAAKFPAFTVLWRQWNDTTQEYDLPSNLLINTSTPTAPIQTGTGNGGGERRVTLTAGSLKYVTATTYTSDQDVRAKIKPVSWAPGGSATRTIVSRYNASGSSRGWLLWLDGTGHLNWTWSANGTADLATVTSTAIVPFTSAAAGWVRAVHDVDNGASGNDVKFYTSSDGATWTQLGSTITTAGITVSAATTADYQLGSRNTTAQDTMDGDIYWVEVRPGAGTTTVVPPLPDDWDRLSTATSVAFSGAPVLMLLCGSVSGQNLAYFDDSTKRPKMLIPHGQDVVFVSTSHNEGNPTNGSWITALNTYITNLKAAIPRVPIIIVGQNPITAAFQPEEQRQDRAARGAQAMTYAASQQGLWAFDAWPAFDGADLSVVIEPGDGVHPTQGNGGTSGSDIWGNYAFKTLFGGL